VLAVSPTPKTVEQNEMRTLTGISASTRNFVRTWVEAKPELGISLKKYPVSRTIN
jgi:hypothetical protein